MRLILFHISNVILEICNIKGKTGENVPWLTVTNIERRGPSPGMLDISDLMTGGQAFGGVVADGVSAGLLLPRLLSKYY